jgi:hypothetical protein
VEKLEKFSRAAFFSLFSAIGILSVTLAVLGPEWKNLYKIKAATKQSEQNNRKIEQIMRDQEELISRINKDPNMLKRLVPANLGQKPEEPNMPAVEITTDTLTQARAVLEWSNDDENPRVSQERIPARLQRATLKMSRVILFAAGTGLVLVSFVCFAARPQPESRRARKETVTSDKPA